jgi:hypothetical protein
VVATNIATGCTANMNGSDTVTTITLPTPYSVTGGGGYCIGGTGVAVNLSGSQPGITYQLYNGGTPVGGTFAGTGSPIAFGPQTVAGTYTVVASVGTTGCTAAMSGSAVVTVNSLPVAYSVIGGGGFCAGGAGVTIGLTGSQIGVNYQLYNGISPWGAPVAGTGGSISFGLSATSGTYTVIATNPATTCSASMTGSATITVSSTPAVVPVTGGGSYCSGGAGVHVGLAGSSVGVNYQLYRGATLVGSPVAGSGSTIDFGLITISGTYTVVATTTSTGCMATMSGSAVISINPLPAVYAVTGGGSFCAGGTGVSIGLSGSASGINYQLMRGTTVVGSPVAGTGGAISFGLQTVAGTYTVVATNTTTGCASNMSGSAVVVVNATPAVYTVTGGGAYCAGGTSFHVGLSGSNTGIRYQLYRGTTSVGGSVSGTGSSIDFGIMSTAGIYTVVATSTATGCTATMSGSATITVNPLPTAFSVTGGGSYCAGGPGVHVGLSGSSAGINYQLYRGTIPVGSSMSGTGSALDFGFQAIPGTYTVIATNAATGCTRNMTGSASVTVNTAPTVYTVTGGGSYCAGSGYHIGLSGSQPGVRYQLYLSGTPLGGTVAGTGAALDFGLFITLGTYTVVATNTSTSCTSNMSGSATISSGTLPTAYTVTGGGTLCSGGTGFAIGLSGSQSGIHYQLYRGTATVGTPLAGTGSALSFGVMTTAGGYTVVATNTATGCVRSMTGSATIIVNPTPTISGSIYTVAPGANITLSGSLSGGTWTSSFTSVATVGASTGVVHGVTIGTTTISYTMSTGCRATHVVSVTATGHRAADDSTSAMVVTTQGNTLYIVPNPNHGLFTVKGSLGVTSDVDVVLDITDMLGRTIYTNRVVAHNGELNEVIQLNQDVANGMYLLNVHSDVDSKVFHVIVEH